MMETMTDEYVDYMQTPVPQQTRSSLGSTPLTKG